MSQNNSPITREIDPSIKEVLKERLNVFLDGECYEFAIAMYRQFGWPLVGLILFDNDLEVRHAAVIHPEGGYFDARGITTEPEFSRPFSEGEIINFGCEESLRARIRPVNEYSIASAERIAMAYWPDLPWSTQTPLKRMLTFVEELEALSRKHEVWIACPLSNPNMWPHVAYEQFVDAHYEIQPFGLTYGISRVYDR